MAFRDFLDRYRASPFTNGGAVPPSRPLARGATPREAALERELAALRAEQDALAKQERAAAANLADMRDALDVLAGEIDVVASRTRDPALRENGAAMIGNVKAFAAREGGIGPNTARAVTQAIKIALGIERSPWAGGPAPAAAPAQPAAVRADPQAIIDAGNRAAGRDTSTDVRTGQPRPLPSPVSKLDPIARGIVQQGRIAKGEKLDD